VGSSFNDVLSIKVNDVEVALDNSGGVITVNNNFFDGSLTPVGTMFDGQTPTLAITAPLASGQSNVITLKLSDVGDGFYDSAGFISDFQLNQSQAVFVDFNEGNVSWNNSLIAKVFGEDEFTLPGSGLNEADQTAIITNLEMIYDLYNIDFVTERPNEGDYSVLHIGGETSDLQQWMRDSLDLNPGNTLLGLASAIDEENKNKSDSAFILSGHLSGVDSITQTAAHELGHILGLFHVDGATELMYPFGDPARISILNQDSNLAYIDENNVIQTTANTQNHHEELVIGVGVKSGSQVVEGSSLFDNIKKFFGFNLTGTNSIFDSFAVVTGGDGYIFGQTEIGDINAGSNFGFTAAAPEGANISIIGKSSKSGEYDTFFSDGTVSDSSYGAALLGDGKFSINSVKENSMGIFQVANDGSLTEVDDVQSTLIDINDYATESGATIGDDTLEGTSEDNFIFALIGNDKVDGLGGDDFLFGDSGDDTLSGGAGNDQIDGGTGNDIILDGMGKNKLDGGNGVDQLLTFSGLNELDGGGDSDYLAGGFQADQLSGGTGNDVLRGDAGSFLGGSDVIEGGADDDFLMGGRGADTFVFNTNDGSDIIATFDVADIGYGPLSGYTATATGSDFQTGIDHIQLDGFSTVNSSNVMSSVMDGADGAVFSAEGTNITFFGVTANQLTTDDFMFL